MEISEALKEEGWHLSNDAIQRISENGAITNTRTLHSKALDLDLREISVPFFPDDIAKGKLDSVPGNVIVQVQKVRNISAPKANEDSQAAPRMLKVLLTDGHTTCYGIEVEHIGSLSLNTVPGTKVVLRGESLSLSHGLLLLRPAVVTVLGGRVTVTVSISLTIDLSLVCDSLNTVPGTKVVLRGESLSLSHGLLLLRPAVVTVLGGRVTVTVSISLTIDLVCDSLNTVPGTKAVLRGESLSLSHGLLLLRPAVVTVLGGRVTVTVSISLTIDLVCDSLNTVPGTKVVLRGESLSLSHGLLLLRPAVVTVLGGLVTVTVSISLTIDLSLVCDSLNTVPGTKVVLRGESLSLSHGLLLLRPAVVTVLGGRVTVTVSISLTIDLSLVCVSLNTVPGTKVVLRGESLSLSHGLLLLRPAVVTVLGGRVTVTVSISLTIDLSLVCDSLNTVPGTKVVLRGESLSLSHGLLLLRPAVVTVLGGRVTVLIDKWELNRSLAKHTRGRIGEEGGPPPWIPFGQKILRPNLQDKNFKSLVDGGAKENAEFEAQRQGAIAEAARGGARKVFGGGTKPIVDRNVRTIMDFGYTQDQAEQALRQTRNNVDRALQNLQRKSGGGGGGGKGGGGERGEGREERRGERGGRRRGDREEEGGSGPKPSGQVSLFAFLEDKLPTTTEKEEKENENHTSGGYNHSSNSQRYNNNMNQKGRTERGSKGRGNYNGPSESRNRDERSRPNNPPMQNQKPPRFQNQQQRHSDAYQGWSYGGGGGGGGGYDDRNSFNSRLGRGYDDYSDGYSRRPPPPMAHAQPYESHDYGRAGGRRYDMHTSNGPSYKGSQARQMMEAGMPEIPEFPFKDASSLPPLLSNNTPSYFHTNSVPPPPHSVPPPPPHSVPPPPPHSVPPPGLGTNGETPAWVWKIGDKCMAKYWEDNMYYNAEVTGLSKKTCVVKFLEYGNFEEVLQADCLPVTEEPLNQSNQHGNANSNPNSNNNHFSGILEFRRGGTRPYIKSMDSGHRKAQRNSQPMYVPPAQRKD